MSQRETEFSIKYTVYVNRGRMNSSLSSNNISKNRPL